MGQNLKKTTQSNHPEDNNTYKVRALTYVYLSAWASKLMKFSEAETQQFAQEIVSLSVSTPEIIFEHIKNILQKHSISVDLDQLQKQFEDYQRLARIQVMDLNRAP
ncbi:hypothetical protein GQ61_09240 [Candidatus Nucleicultrix amoebiphila FS5]|jgi:hypothetical protein|uniref:Uncharacterized protein n=1 Tax=Candidatus Nucleicultrix amoebiphila FS5 TaxID=1414854 RepID=A0A1W6N6L3_9PROT|nr:hypothetical protein GQ61_09240 [Candidatus Nucleicultrix amoebiphila FS5]